MLHDMGILFSISTLLCSQSPSVLPSFPRDASSFSTKTTVLWTCARLFAGHWLQDATRVGTATNDLLFPSGKAEQSDGEMEQGGGMSPMSREQGHVAVQVPGPGKCQLRGARQFCTASALGPCQDN